MLEIHTMLSGWKNIGVRRLGCDNEANRHLWVRLALAKIPEGKRLLDAGAGTQRYRKFCGHLRYVSQDFAQYDGRGDDRGLQTGKFEYGTLNIVSDITAIPEPSESFDVVLCTEVLEHVPAPEKALSELIRLLKPGGDLLLTAPFVSFTHFAPFHYCTGFNRYFYEDQLKRLEIVEISTNGSFFEFLAQEVRRIEPIAFKYAGVRYNLFDRILRRLLLYRLAKFQRSDKGSSEFACFGLHVHARKRLY